MAYSVSTLKSAWKDVQGRVHVCWTIVQKEIDANQEWQLTGLPPFLTITLFEAATSTTYIRPGLGTKQSWTAGSIEDLAINDGLQLKVRNQDSQRVTVPDGTLFGRNNPDASGSYSLDVTTRITYVEGH